MTRNSIALALALVGCAHAADVSYIAEPLQEMPACTPVTIDAGRRVSVEDVNGKWERVRLHPDQAARLPVFAGFDQCIDEVPAYAGRYTQAQLDALAAGELAAGMPLEFALMILGPPDQPPGVFSMIDPMTGTPRTYRTLMWMKTFGRVGKLTAAFNLVGGIALGVAANASSLTAAGDALSVATTAAAANIVTWSLGSLADARIVTIQADEADQITILTAQ